MKICFACKVVLPLSEFTRATNSKDGYRGRCRKCVNAYLRDRYWNKPGEREKLLARNIPKITRKRKHERMGLTEEEYQRLAASGCAICGITDPGTHHGRFCADHDHATGKFRGLLCQRHNLALGHFKDSIEEMRAAISYLGHSVSLAR